MWIKSGKIKPSIPAKCHIMPADCERCWRWRHLCRWPSGRSLGGLAAQLDVLTCMGGFMRQKMSEHAKKHVLLHGICLVPEVHFWGNEFVPHRETPELLQERVPNYYMDDPYQLPKRWRCPIWVPPSIASPIENNRIRYFLDHDWG